MSLERSKFRLDLDVKQIIQDMFNDLMQSVMTVRSDLALSHWKEY
jgi:hypothetical protein